MQCMMLNHTKIAEQYFTSVLICNVLWDYHHQDAKSRCRFLSKHFVKVKTKSLKNIVQMEVTDTFCTVYGHCSVEKAQEEGGKK